jgi:hypothetical protein
MVVIRINEMMMKKKKKNERGGQLKVGIRTREETRERERERERARASARGLKNPRVVASSKHKEKSSSSFRGKHSFSLFSIVVVLSMMHT